MEKNFVFKTLDNMPRMIFWGVDEFVIMAAPFFIGLLFGSVFMMLSGLVLKKFYCRWKKRYPRGLIMHALYWNLPTRAFIRFGVFKRLPHSHVRDFLT